MPDSPFIKDVPAAQALAAWRAAREAAGCPDRLPAVTVPVTEAAASQATGRGAVALSASYRGRRRR